MVIARPGLAPPAPPPPRSPAVAQCVGIPVGLAEQMLNARGHLSTADLGQLPAMFACGWTHSPGEIGHGPRVGFGAVRRRD